MKANSPQKIREALNAQRRRLETIRGELDAVAGAISDERVQEIKNKVGELVKYEQAVSASAKLAFGDLDIPGIGSDAWREMLLAAAKYSTRDAYPSEAES